MRVVSNPVKLNDAGFRHSSHPPVRIRDPELLAELGFTAEEVADMLREGATRETK